MADRQPAMANGVVRTVVSVAIVSAAVWLTPPARALVIHAVNFIGDYITQIVSVPRLIIIALVLAAVPSLLPVINWLRGQDDAATADEKKAAPKNTPDPEPVPDAPALRETPAGYVDLRWRWHYKIWTDETSPLCAYCPFDDTALVFTEAEGWITFRCEKCGRSFGPVFRKPESHE